MFMFAINNYVSAEKTEPSFLLIKIAKSFYTLAVGLPTNNPN